MKKIIAVLLIVLTLCSVSITCFAATCPECYSSDTHLHCDGIYDHTDYMYHYYGFLWLYRCDYEQWVYTTREVCHNCWSYWPVEILHVHFDLYHDCGQSDYTDCVAGAQIPGW